jgi:hypothetical protein
MIVNKTKGSKHDIQKNKDPLVLLTIMFRPFGFIDYHV